MPGSNDQGEGYGLPRAAEMMEGQKLETKKPLDPQHQLHHHTFQALADTHMPSPLKSPSHQSPYHHWTSVTFIYL